MEERVYKVRGRKEDLDNLEKALRHIEYLGNIGASRNILIRVDGDGAGRIRIENSNGHSLDNEQYNVNQSVEHIAVVGIYDIG